MNIYEKLQSMRCELQGKNLKKSGKNAFVGYGYFELSDIIPEINSLMEKHKITSMIEFNKETAKLTLVNSEKPEEALIFTSPMSDAALKGCHAVQNLGATMTYLRRYLWINAFEIVEADILDATHTQEHTEQPIKHVSEEKKTPQGTQVTYSELISEPQRKRLYAIGKTVDMPADMFNDWLMENYGIDDTKNIKKEWYEAICSFVQGYVKG